jgi:hypothetical protein
VKPKLGECRGCLDGTPATETVEYGSPYLPSENYCAECAVQVRHLWKVSENRRAGGKKAVATRRTNRRKLAESLGPV